MAPLSALLRSIAAVALLHPLAAQAHGEAMFFIPLLQLGCLAGVVVGAVAGALRDQASITLLPSVLIALVVLGLAAVVWTKELAAFPYAIAYGALASGPFYALFFVFSKELTRRASVALRERKKFGASASSENG